MPLISEDLDELLEMSDRIVVMIEGRIVFETARPLPRDMCSERAWGVGITLQWPHDGLSTVRSRMCHRHSRASTRMSTVAGRRQPLTFEFDPAKTALVVIDMQRDFIEPGGSVKRSATMSRCSRRSFRPPRTLAAWREAGGSGASTRAKRTARLSDCPPAKRNRGNPSLRIGDEGPMGRILIAGEPGNEIIDGLAPIAGEIVIDKPGKGAFYATGLHEILRGAASPICSFAGVTTEVCVQTTMREANDRGYECLLIEDCTESYFPASRRPPWR